MLLVFSAAILIGCSDQDSVSNKRALIATSDPELGKSLFAANCKSCHGSEAMGTKLGPPLIHKIYEPGHHADFSFYRAVSFGVRSHHWEFGDMPKIPGVSPQEVAHIIAYIRQEQHRAGIY
jgi:cytochrome c2